MSRPIAAALLAVPLLAAPVQAKSQHGVKVPDQQAVAGKELKLNGIGLRTKTIFNVKVYAAALYLEQPMQDGAQVLQSDQVKRVEMIMLRDLSRAQIVDAIREAFAKNAGDKLPQLQERLENFVAVVPDVKEGQRLTITYVPNRGTSVSVSGGEEKVSVGGKDFADALFSVWLGAQPVDGSLKAGMLGKED